MRRHPAGTSIRETSVATIMPQRANGQEGDRRKTLKWLAAREGIGEHVAIGKLKCAARREAAGKPGDPHRVSVKRLATKSEVPSPSRFGFVARISSAIDPDWIRAIKASIVNCSGP